MNRIAALLVGLVMAALAIRFAADLIAPALPLLIGLAVAGLIARRLFAREDRW